VPQKPRKMDPNDGRAPDTIQLLHPRGVQDAGTENKNIKQSYAWQSLNSCFFDNGLELWYQAYTCWPSTVRDNFLTMVPTSSFLGCFIFHCDRRLKNLHQPTDSKQAFDNLEMMQFNTRHYIFNKWKLYADPCEYGCAKT